MVTAQRTRALILRATGFPDLSLDSQEFASLQGAKGFGAPPRTIRWWDGAGDGSVARSVRTNRRPLVIPTLIQAPDVDTLEDRLSALAQRFDPDRGDLAVRLILDEGAEQGQWYLDAVYVDGLDYTYGTDTNGLSWAKINLAFECGIPFWTRIAAASIPIVAAGAGRGLLKGNVSISALRQASGQTIGTITMVNEGDAKALPVTTLYGPALTGSFVSGGKSYTWAGNLLVGQVRIFDHRLGTLVDGAGVNKYNELGPAPKFWPVPAGSSQASVVVTGDTPGTTKVVISYQPRKWLVI